MPDFDYIIIGGGCAGLSLAYNLEINGILATKSLAIIDPRDSYFRDKSWSFWKIFNHNFEDCVIKNWYQFDVKIPNAKRRLNCKRFPYQMIDSGLFYEKILDKLRKNPNVVFLQNESGINKVGSVIFNSVYNKNNLTETAMWQHFEGYEIEVEEDIFNEEIVTLMDFDCDQKGSTHFFYILPFSKTNALIESTWLSKMTDPSEQNYDQQISHYIEKKLNIGNYKIKYKENGKIPMFEINSDIDDNIINIGTAGGMTRLSTGYTFLNIQQQCEYILKNLDEITTKRPFKIPKKYQYLDKIFLSVMDKNPQRMPAIFFEMFGCNPETIIKFLSNKSNFISDISIISAMPKKPFIRAIIGR
tara:strand:- start:1534 stop:2607 length:1074 start_codon:yes stop_codon:yes gene_type:complete